MKREDALFKHKSGSAWLILYLMLLVPAVLLAAVERLIPWLGGTVPDVFRPAWPHRQLILAGLSTALFLLLAGALTFGFGLEKAAAAAAEEAAPAPQPAADLPSAPTRQSQLRVRDLRRDVELASYALDRTWWLTLAVAAHIVALLGSITALWMDHHPNRPDPRVEFYC